MNASISSCPREGVDRSGLIGTVVCMGALTLILTISTLCSRYVNLVGSDQFGLPRYGGSLCVAVGYAVLAAVSYFKLGIVAYRRVSVAMVAAAAGFALLFTLGRNNLAAFMAGLCLYAAVYVWMNFLLACCLVRLPSLRAAAAAVIGGPIVHQFALFACGRIQDPALLPWLGAALCVLVVAGLAVFGAPLFRSLASRDAVALLELTNPLSALKPPGRLYICVFLISATYYFANAFGVPTLGLRRTLVVVLLLVFLYLLLVRGENQEDRLFSILVLCIMAGMLMEPLLLERDVFIAHTCIFVGFKCFTILVWLLVYGLGVRNITVMVPFFGVVSCLDALGRCVGTQLGRDTVGMVGSGPLATQAVILCLALFFFAFVWLGFRTFSFTEAIRGIESIEPVSGPSLDEGQVETSELLEARQTHLRERCEYLARKASLTPRETQILELLARGRNAQFIMDELTITRNTAKAHIRHVYTKLGVHSQQELLTLVEGEGSADGDGES